MRIKSRCEARVLETEYHGITFRSRTEARWAVFFDSLRVAWEYEPEGFELSPNRRYLPDFLLPELGGNGGTYLEVKGRAPTEAEQRRCRDLADATGRRVLLAIRAPFPPSIDQTPSDGSILCFYPDGDSDRGYAFFACASCGVVDVAWLGVAYGCWCDNPGDSPTTHPAILAAYAASRSARFGT